MIKADSYKDFYKDDFNFAILIDVEVELKEKEKNEMRLF